MKLKINHITETAIANLRKSIPEMKEINKIDNEFVVVTTTNENLVYCGFVPTVYQMWKKYCPNCKFVLGVISNKSEDDNFIQRCKEFCDDFYLFKELGIETGVQAKVSRLYLSTLYNEDVVTIVDVDQYLLNFEWFADCIKEAYNDKFVSIGYNAYVNTVDRGKWPMPYTTAKSHIFKKIVNYNNNIENYEDWINSLKVISDPIDNKERVTNKFDNYSDESTLRYLVERHKERDYIYSIWHKVDREDAITYNLAHKRLDRWNWSKFSITRLASDYYLDVWPLRPFEKNINKLFPILEYLKLDMSNEKLYLNG